MKSFFQQRFSLLSTFVVVFLIASPLLLGCDAAIAQDESKPVADTPDKPAAESPDEKAKPKEIDFSVIEEQFTELTGPYELLKKTAPKKAEEFKDQEIWVSMKDKVVMVGATVCLNRGQLEMFACTRGTKEHESILVVKSKAFLIHLMLLAIGADEGDPVSYDPEYKPATGSEIAVEVHWFDKSGMATKANAQEWIKNSRTEKQMKHPWVFAGSDFYEEESGIRHYLAEGGEVICVSNFTTAMLDLPVKSSDLNDGLLFSAFEERIPPLGTPVRITLKVKDTKEKKVKDSTEEKSATEKSKDDVKSKDEVKPDDSKPENAEFEDAKSDDANSEEKE